VNLASRIKDATPSGAIYVGPSTWEHTRRDFEFRTLQPMRFKGTESTVPVRALASKHEQQHRSRPVVGERSMLTRMVGREDELQAIRARLAALAGGEGGIVAVIGEAGLGKSRLVSEATSLPELAGTRFLTGRSLSMGEGLSFHPFIDLLREWAGIDETDDDAVAHDKLAAAVTETLPDKRAEIFPFVARLMGIRVSGADAERLEDVDAEGMERLIARAVRELLEALTAERPLLLFFEDLHWADLSSIGLLLGLFPVTKRSPLLIVTAFRPAHETTSDRVLATARDRFAEQLLELPLGPLDASQCATLLRNLIRVDDRPSRTQRLVLSRAEGNPFFIEEVVRSLVDLGAIEQTAEGLRVTERIEDVEVPGTVQEVVMARVDRLPDHVRSILQIASVIGRTFPARILATVVPDANQLDYAIGTLKRRQLLENSRTGDEAGYAFSHALAQDTVYESTLRKTRRTLHAEVAAAIERVFADRLSDYFGMLAYHYGRAQDLEKAGEYLVKAGDESERSAASNEALAYFRDAAKVYQQVHGDGGDPTTKALFEKKIGLAYLNRGDLEEALEHFDGALTLYGQQDPTGSLDTYRRLVLDLSAILYHVYVRRGRPRRTQPDESTLETIEIRFHKGKAQSTTAPQGYFLSMLRGIRAINGVDPSAIEQASGIYAASAALFAYSGISFGVSARLLPIAKRLVGNVRDELGYRTMAFLHDYLAGSWQTAQEIDDSLLDEGLRRGILWEINTYLGLVCEQKIGTGDFQEAATLIDRIARIGDDYGYDFVLGNVYFMSAFLAQQCGETADALRHIDRYHRQFTLEALNLLALGQRARIAHAAGDVVAAEAACDEAQDLAGRLGQQAAPYHIAPYRIARFLLDVDALEHADRPGAAEVRAARQSGRAAVRIAGRIARERPEALKLMGRYFAVQGKARKARAWYGRAMQEAQRMGARPELARIYLEAAERIGTINGVATDELRARGTALSEDLARTNGTVAEVLAQSA
jgi:tetratricopeptide (TPR) repeat protein